MSDDKLLTPEERAEIAQAMIIMGAQMPTTRKALARYEATLQAAEERAEKAEGALRVCVGALGMLDELVEQERAEKAVLEEQRKNWRDWAALREATEDYEGDDEEKRDG